MWHRLHKLERVGLLQLSALLENVTSHQTHEELPENVLRVKGVRRIEREHDAGPSFFCHTPTTRPGMESSFWTCWWRIIQKRTRLIRVNAQTALSLEATPLMAEQLRTQMEGQTRTRFLWEYTWKSQSTQRLSVFCWQILGGMSTLCLVQSSKDSSLLCWDPSTPKI